MTPLFQRSCVAVVGRSSLSLYDTRSQESGQRPSVVLNVVRTSMGAFAPARAAISPEGTYIACIMNRSVNVYDFRRSSGSGGKNTQAVVALPFIADQKPVSVCWMRPACGCSLACGNSTGDVLVHDVASGKSFTANYYFCYCYHYTVTTTLLPLYCYHCMFNCILLYHCNCAYT